MVNYTCLRRPHCAMVFDYLKNHTEDYHTAAKISAATGLPIRMTTAALKTLLSDKLIERAEVKVRGQSALVGYWRKK